MSGRRVRFALITGIIAFLLVLGMGTYDRSMAVAAGKTAVVTGSGVNVRSGPGTGYSKTGSVTKGAALAVLEQKNGWYKLQLPGNKTGWVKGDYLSISESMSSGKVSVPVQPGVQQGKSVIVKASTANIRSGPGTGYTKVGSAAKGQRFAVVKEAAGWYKVSTGGSKAGWIFGNLVTVVVNRSPGGSSGTGNNPAPAADVKEIYLIVKGSIVNVRSGPGTGYGIVAKVKSGDQLTALKKSAGWYLAALPGEKPGWIVEWLVETRSTVPPSRGDNKSEIPDQPKPPEPAPNPMLQKLTGIEFNNIDGRQESLVVRSEGAIKHAVSFLRDPARLVIDIDGCDINGLKEPVSGGTLVGKVRMAQFSLTPMVVRIVLDLNRPVHHKSVLSEDNRVLTVNISEPSIKDKTVVIDAGHGGYDPGALGVSGLQEKDFNLETALLLRDKLAAQGVTVIMTREDDSFISLPGRASVANSAYADVFVSIHANSNPNPATRGTSTYYYAPSSNPLLYGQLEQRQKMADAVQRNLIELLGTRDIGILQDNFAVLRGTEMPSVLVEAAFLSNTDDEVLLKDSSFREKVAQGIADGLAEYFAGI